MGQVQIRGFRSADRRRAAAMAEWEDADPRARKDGGDSGYSNGDGEYSRRHQWRRSRCG